MQFCSLTISPLHLSNRPISLSQEQHTRQDSNADQNTVDHLLNSTFSMFSNRGQVYGGREGHPLIWNYVGSMLSGTRDTGMEFAGQLPWPPPNVSLGLTGSQRLCFVFQRTWSLRWFQRIKSSKSLGVQAKGVPEPTGHFSPRAACLLSFRCKYFSRLLPPTKPPRFSKVWALFCKMPIMTFLKELKISL